MPKASDMLAACPEMQAAAGRLATFEESRLLERLSQSRDLKGSANEPSLEEWKRRAIEAEEAGNRHVLQRAVLAAILVSRADDSEMHGPTCCTCCRCGLGVEGEMVIDEGNHGPDICTCCPHLDDVLSQQNKSWQRDRDMKSPQPDGSSPYLHDTPETSEDEGDESGKGMSEA